MADWRSRTIAAGIVGWLLAHAGASAASAENAPAPMPSGGLHRDLDRASDFAPVGVLLDHTHQKGDWTFLFRYRRDEEQGLLDGDVPVTVSEVAQTYPVVPLSFVQNRYTAGVMYAPLERLTFALLLPVVQNHLEQQTAAGVQVDETAGIGDAKFMFLIPFVQKEDEKTQLNVGVTFPTGSIEQRDASGQRLPYVMQLGSGTWDVIWGITYTGTHERLSWGGQFEGEYRISYNSVGYRLGTVYQASAWVAGSFGRWLSASGRFAWSKQGNIKGRDPTLQMAPPLTPLNDPYKQGGTTLEVGPGVNVLLPILGGQRLSVEALFPVYQDLDGPQLASDVKIVAGWQWIY